MELLNYFLGKFILVTIDVFNVASVFVVNAIVNVSVLLYGVFFKGGRDIFQMLFIAEISFHFVVIQLFAPFVLGKYVVHILGTGFVHFVQKLSLA